MVITTATGDPFPGSSIAILPSSGTASFSGLRVRQSGVGYAIRALAAGLTSTSASFDVSPGSAAQLVFDSQPPSTVSGAPFTARVSIADSFGNTLTTSNAPVSLSLAANPSSGSLSGATSVAATNGVATFTVHIDSAGTGYALGAASAGLTGATTQPFEVKPGFSFLTAKWAFTCGLARGHGYCWGYNVSGQLGSGSVGFSSPPVAIAGNTLFSSISAGDGHACALSSGGTASCWGDNSSGQLGTGDTVSIATPVAVTGGLTFTQISVGTHHTCGVAVGGNLYCWGMNANGQLGDTTTVSKLAPVAVAGGLTWSSVASGLYSTCGLASSGAAYCWGDSSGTARPRPSAVPGGQTFASLQGGGYHDCGLTPSGTAFCWGLNTSGQLGDGTTSSSPFIPVAVAGGYTFSKLFLGGSHTCGITTGGAAYCWGSGQSGELGNGVAGNGATPVPVAGALQFVSFALGDRYTCGRTAVGTTYCWGYNGQGELGDGTQTGSLTPVLVVY